MRVLTTDPGMGVIHHADVAQANGALTNLAEENDVKI